MTKVGVNVDLFRLSPSLRRLRDDLSQLPTPHRVAFSLYCSERLFPFYAALADDIGSADASVLRTLLDELWRLVAGGTVSQEEIKRFTDQLDQIDLGEEGCSDAWDGAVDAVGAASLALEAWFDGTSESAAKAGGNVRNRVYQRLMDEAVGPTNVVSADEAMALARQIEEHPAMKSVQQQLLEIIGSLSRRSSLTESDLRQLRSLTPGNAL